MLYFVAVLWHSYEVSRNILWNSKCIILSLTNYENLSHTTQNYIQFNIPKYCPIPFPLRSNFLFYVQSIRFQLQIIMLLIIIYLKLKHGPFRICHNRIVYIANIDQLRTTIYFKLITTDSPNFYHKLEMLIQWWRVKRGSGTRKRKADNIWRLLTCFESK